MRYQHAAQGRHAEIAAKFSDLNRPPETQFTMLTDGYLFRHLN